MARLKNITPSVISLQIYKTNVPKVNYVEQNVVVSLKPGEDLDEAAWLVSNINDPSYNADLIEGYIKQGIITRIP